MTKEEIRALEKDDTVTDTKTGIVHTYKGKEGQHHIFVNKGMQLAIPDYMLDSYAPLFEHVPVDSDEPDKDEPDKE